MSGNAKIKFFTEIDTFVYLLLIFLKKISTVSYSSYAIEVTYGKK